MKHEIPDEAMVREGLRLARVLRISRLEASTRLRKTIIEGGGRDVPLLYATMIRFETPEQWQNLPTAFTEDTTPMYDYMGPGSDYEGGPYGRVIS